MLDVDAKITGLNGLQRELGLLDATIRKELRREAKQVTRPLVDDAKKRYPKTTKNQPPLRGTNYAWTGIGGDGFPYNQTRAKRGVRFSCDISRAGRTVFRVRQIDAAAAVLETAGKASPNALGRAVASHYGTRNRFMWAAAQAQASSVRRELESVILRLVYGINRKNDRDARQQGRM